jgi:hypothetical protein
MGVVVLRIAAVYPAEENAERVFFVRHGNQVYVVRHQAIAYDSDAGIAEVVLQKSQVGGSILVRGENFTTIHTSLGNVAGKFR